MTVEGQSEPETVQEESTALPDELEMQSTLRVLTWLAENPAYAASQDELARAVALAYKRVRKQRRVCEARAAEMHAQSSPLLCCYICSHLYRRHDGPFPLLCPACVGRNQEHRTRRGDLRGRRAVVTGARVKVGYETALKLLRDGATVIATTRFPRDAACRYAAESDFEQWKDRLVLYGLDLRDLRSLQAFARFVHHSGAALDILINNAAQTLRPPATFYQAMHARELSLHEGLSDEALQLLAPATKEPPSLLPSAENAQVLKAMDAPQWPVSSWKLPLEEVEPIELGEVMLINTMAPFLLCSAFEPLMRNSRFIDRYIVNVTSAEGQFERRSKPAEHPHTNMAKAALNMLTRTAASRCAADWIYMNSVDPGWITHMAVESMLPAENATEPRDAFVPPLDAVDGAARVYDPILRGIHGEPVSGLLLRDYQPAPW